MVTRWTIWAVVLGVACTSPPPSEPDDTEDTDEQPTVDTDDTDEPVDTAPVDTAPVDTGPEEPPGPDCSVLPPVPATFHTLHGYSAAEDFDFDDQGYQISVFQNALAGKDQAGDIRIISPNIGSWTAGTRSLATGDFVIADAGAGTVVLVDGTTGAKTPILTGLDYPNGLEVDADHQVYVAEQSRGRITQVDPYTGDSHVVAENLNNPNGLVLSPDGTILYAGSFGGGMVYSIRRTAPGVWEPAKRHFQSAGNDGGYDGINVDVCGNVYFTEYTNGKIWRVSADGSQVDLVTTLPSFWIPNMRWGSNRGGWDPEVLYVSDRDQGRIFGLELGIAGPKHLLAP